MKTRLIGRRLVYLESRIFMSSFVFSLALCIVFILSLYVCYSCYYNNFVSILTIGYQLDEHALAFLVACHFVLNLYYVITVYSVYCEINMMMMMINHFVCRYVLLGNSTSTSSNFHRVNVLHRTTDLGKLLSIAHENQQ